MVVGYVGLGFLPAVADGMPCRRGCGLSIRYKPKLRGVSGESNRETRSPALRSDNSGFRASRSHRLRLARRSYLPLDRVIVHLPRYHPRCLSRLNLALYSILKPRSVHLCVEAGCLCAHRDCLYIRGLMLRRVWVLHLLFTPRYRILADRCALLPYLRSLAPYLHPAFHLVLSQTQ